MITSTPPELATDGRPPAPAAAGGRSRKAPAPVSVMASLTLAATTVATAVSFCRIFAGWDFLPSVLITALAVHAVMTLGRAIGWPIWIAAPVAAVTLAVVVGMLYYRSTLWGVIPTRATWDAGWVSIADAFAQFRTTVAPVPSDGGYAVATALAMGLVAGLADTFAFRAFGRIESIVPGGLLFALASSLGVDRLRLPVSALWLGSVIMAIAVLRASHGDQGATWLGNRASRRLGPTVRAAAVLGVVAVGAGLIFGPRVPGVEEEPIINTRTRNGDGTEILSPMVDVQARLVKRSNTEMFTVRLDGEPAYLRVASLGDFDGKAFTSEADYADAVDFSAEPVGGAVREIRQQIRISALGSVWLPAIYSPIAINPTADFEFDPETAGLVRQDKLYNGLTYEVVSRVSALTPADLQATASFSPPPGNYLDLPGDFPTDLVRRAQEITAGAPTVYDQMIALQNFFRNNFTYNATVSRGHSIRSIEAFLRAKEGYCEQFATTFAAFARVVGVPSRVAVGFTPGDKDASGVWHVLGKHAHAWPEIWFDGIGWVPFEPTPGRGAPGAESYTGVAPDQEGGTLQGTPDPGEAPVPGNQPTRTTRPTSATVANARPTLPFEGTVPRDPRPQAAGGAKAKTTSVPTALKVIGGMALAAGAWILLMPFVVRFVNRRRRREPVDQVTRHWTDATKWLGLAGAPYRPDETPIEYAERAWRTAGIAREPVRDLAKATTNAIYRPVPPTPADVDAAGELSHRIVRIARGQVGIRSRARALVDPRLVV